MNGLPCSAGAALGVLRSGSCPVEVIAPPGDERSTRLLRALVERRLTRLRPGAALDLARIGNSSAPLVHADLWRLPFRDRAFTLVFGVFATFVALADEPHGQVLREVSRVAALGGYLVLDLPNGSSLSPVAPHDVEAPLTESGFRVADVCGDYDGTPLVRDSPRAIFFARRVMLRGC